MEMICSCMEFKGQTESSDSFAWAKYHFDERRTIKQFENVLHWKQNLRGAIFSV